jgi:hypothetical protein
MAQLCEACASQHELESPHFEDEFELEDETAMEGEGWLGAIGNVVGSLLGESELESELEDEGEFEGEGEFESESEFEDESEFESELSPIRKIYPDAMMEHLGELAAHAETEDEAAEHFLPLIGMAASKLLPVAAKALAPMAKKTLPRVVKAVTRATPQLTKGVTKIARGLHRSPAARPLLRAVPTIARRTVHSIAKQAAHGRNVTLRMAVKALARQTQHVLGHPSRRAQVLRRHGHMERRFHHGIGRGIVRPHWRWQVINGRRVRVPYHAAAPAHTGTAPRAAAGGTARRTAATGHVTQAPRYGQSVGGQCVCPACPSCGTALAPAATAAPAYCRCCGQVLR